VCELSRGWVLQRCRRERKRLQLQRRFV
jgi:hypothetical protein